METLTHLLFRKNWRNFCVWLTNTARGFVADSGNVEVYDTP